MEKEIRWSAPEYHHYDKDVSWYWLLTIIAFLLLVPALWQGNFLFAVFIVVAAFLVASWGKRKPKNIDFVLSEKGLAIGEKKFYPYANLEGFAIIAYSQDPELEELILKTRGRLNAWIKIIIAAQRRKDIQNLLGQFLPETEYQESLADHIARLLRF